MQSLQIIDNLSALGERQGAALNTAIELVIRCLRANKIPFSLQDIRIDIPIERSAILTIDGKEAPCKATSFVSGLIQGKDVVLSSAMPMAESPNLPNINVNPYCSEISRGNHYCSPAIAVSPRTLQKIFDGKNIAAAV